MLLRIWTVALLAWAWYHLAWPHAGTALIIATIFCALASSSPRPRLMMRQILAGFLIAWPLTFFRLFFVLPRAGGYPMLALGMAPLLAGGLYVAANPKRAGIGVGIIMFSAQVLAPANLMRIDGADRAASPTAPAATGANCWPTSTRPSTGFAWRSRCRCASAPIRRRPGMTLAAGTTCTVVVVAPPASRARSRGRRRPHRLAARGWKGLLAEIHLQCPKGIEHAGARKPARSLTMFHRHRTRWRGTGARKPAP